MMIQVPRGTADVLPGEIELWQYIEDKARDICRRYNYSEIRTPVFEHTELFQRGVGETTDIVEKEMYTFEDRGGRSLTLRPEGTASTVRAYIEHKMYGSPQQPTKLYYIGPMFRYERPQAGRMRQFTQFGVEAIGSNDPAIDAEVIALAMRLYEELGLKKLHVELNSLGDAESRKAHREALIKHFTPHIHEFCSDCQSRLTRNPLRILDCKKDADKEVMKTAPTILDYLNEASKSYFEKVKKHLDDLGIAYVVNPNLVRGLDYYTHTAFEIMERGIGAVSTICGGGRYNGLVQEIGGNDMPGIGFAMSIERVLLALKTQGVELPIDQGLDCFVIGLGEAAEEKAFLLLNEMRRQGLTADKDYLGRKMKAQMKAADRLQAKVVVIIGEDELSRDIVVLKNMETGDQQEVAFDKVIAKVQEITKNDKQGR
ncbi:MULTISPECIES: histidine--tRNA ligase [Aneurinibacillus]|uniref:Histidine--tRNA ligase n=2 Tax=Aneurinibacillus thermoaerophilus TaxID=143495 RepID=A0ABX8Y9M8_ANETH|nr:MULTISPECIES: histidine--tRNA ligase [Aneurinibacillus]AMA72170.1 histidine--tRNA ligase [Aneurinibacillus sp. XH2]MED0676455.1 histidine--tRNA ligase [Aneurinibacillus thermoaerophilus]MED0678967.1 histidine--tRNA ligase [Aneurinibacillus thermoaerophilus]MED0736504.1 histidine--tRNA ligase [Aneurinibacillus thermoaerophilus]MED0756007.1 histidine--tRNA ligase [Aneurinibacillus thermoaerophilus]